MSLSALNTEGDKRRSSYDRKGGMQVANVTLWKDGKPFSQVELTRKKHGGNWSLWTGSMGPSERTHRLPLIREALAEWGFIEPEQPDRHAALASIPRQIVVDFYAAGSWGPDQVQEWCEAVSANS